MTHSWDVALCSPPYRTFSYCTPDYLPGQAWAIGQRVMVPMGSTHRMGVIMAGGRREDANGRVLKPLTWPLDQELLLTCEVLDLVHHLASRQMVEQGRVLAAILPKALRDAAVRFVLRTDHDTRTITLHDILHYNPGQLQDLGRYWLEGRIAPQATDRAGIEEMTYELVQGPPWNLRPKARQQMAVLDFLHLSGCASVRQIKAHLREVKDAGSPGRLKEVLASLTRKGWIQSLSPGPVHGFNAPPAGPGPRGQTPAPGEAGQGLVPTDANEPGAMPASLAGGMDPVLRPALEPTPEQADALCALQAALSQAVTGKCGLTHLVHGVTGSGKTLMYLRLAESALAMGRSVLLLAPEVALSAQLWAEVCRYFPDIPRHLYHGYLSAGAKLGVFRALRHAATPQIVVGTRSALFLPFANLGLIVLDEEHDASYKQDEGLAYQAKEVAHFRVRQGGGLLVLGSATPDVKTYHAASQGNIAMVALHTRVSRRPLPEICLVDMHGESRSNPLSEQCSAQLREVVSRGEQAMLLLNRRGFAPLVSCLDCATPPKCPHCEVGLTYYKAWERLLCHYCGHTRQFPCVCAQCGGTRFLPMGEGTEGLEEYLLNMVSENRGVVRLDRDTTRRKGRLEDILDSFAQGRSQIMVGTQMLSKGHHFPNVTLVIAVDGDIGLNLPDYRAAEKTFQLLVQLAGRAGRGERPGRVFIQTHNPGHPCWEHIRNGDYQGFFTQELERRRKFAYPPFVKLGMVRFSHPRDWEPGAGLLAKAGEHLRKEGARLGLRVLGPAPAPLSQLKGRKRFQCLLKARHWADLREVYRGLQALIPGSSPMRISLDLDPMNML